MNLGNALWRLGEREASPERLEQAVAAYRAALEALTRERVPLDWAGTQMNLGNALASLGERERSADLLTEALAALRNARSVYVQAGMSQYSDYLTGRIGAIEAAITAMRSG
jgi:tetratricopeptide (TPR) repeat protein